ncbi:Na+/H+ antiporter NhaC family protein [Neopoerus faecalis]|uniref:Na+/H+ antiporter NhaC family protein n=1 Tax=Neopoerus faecalis TaxID=3032125 RepID=UPI002570A4F6|nr:Na+/H+ antiporter NhaC family protein [Neopoerus faecalis]
MKKHSVLRAALLAALAAALLGVPVLAAGEEAAAGSLYGTVWALLPPVIAITLALITKEAYSSLFIGIVVGALFAKGFSPIGALDMIVNDGLVAAISDNAGIFLFLVLLGIIVALVNAAGGSAAFGRWASKNIKTKVGASLATFVLGILIFIDDYFNCLTVGTVMRPVTDSHRISRPKLAYLIDATAAPVCMIAPISSWAAAVSSTAEGLDTGISGIQLFIKAIPYNLYSLLTFVFIIGLSMMQFDYGPMKDFERLARETGELGALKSEEDEKINPKGRVIDLLLPVAVLIICCTVGMIYVGGFFGVDAWGGTDCAGDFIGAFGNTDAFIGLPWGGIIALLFTVIYLLLRRVITFKDAMDCIPKGFNAMISPILILTLAVSLKATITSLGASVYVHDLMEGAASALYSMLPAVIFLVACVLAFASGTSWGTFGILIPIVTAIFPASSELLIIGISACCAGAVMGDHCSPISDTSIMASAGAQCNHLDHVATQLPYVLTVACVCVVGFIVAGFVQNVYITWAVSLALMLGVLFALRSIERKRALSREPIQ